MSLKGRASNQRLNLSTIVKRYLRSQELGRGPASLRDICNHKNLVEGPQCVHESVEIFVTVAQMLVEVTSCDVVF